MTRRLSRIAGGCLSALLVGSLLSPASSTDGKHAPRPVPWPTGRAPSPLELRELVTDAIEVDDLERSEAFLEALERGEDSEHIFLLQERVDAGELDPDALFDLGDAFFEHVFRDADGLGDRPRAGFRRVHTALGGGLDTFSCAGCHSVGGPDGAGAFSQNAFLEGDGVRTESANVRNPPALLGLGLVQALAAEMTRELRRQRDDAARRAHEAGDTITVALTAKGVSFGELQVDASGALNLAGVRGVDRDLEVRPFGWKGHESRLRRFVETASRIHFGIQSHASALRHRNHPDPARLGGGEHWFDPDGDGRQRELEEGTVTAAAIYLAMLETPVILPPRDAGLLERWSRGNELFDRAGCDGCHRRTLKLHRDHWTERPEGEGPGVVLRLLQDGDPPRGTADVELFSDLRRHDMGDALADRHPNSHGIAPGEFLTRPLWGLAESAPYLHDGRAATLPAAIDAHGGEARASRDAYRALSDAERVDLHLFLLSLTRQPRVRVAR